MKQTSTQTLKASTKSGCKGYRTIALITSYWRPGEKYQQQIIETIRNQVQNGDFVTVSEKAISTATGNIVDEKSIEASRLARCLAEPWMRYAWGYVLGTICHLRRRTIKRFRTYPTEEGSRHKQLALEEGGLLQALMHGSEAAIDGSNLPYSFVSLPLQNAAEIAAEIRHGIRTILRVEVAVMIVDTDKSYTYRNFHFTPRPKPIRGIQSFGGVFAYLLGRGFKLKTRSTPIAISGSGLDAETALQIAETANRARGFGAGRNVWDMAETFDVALTEVTWEMLDKVEHKPIVIVRPSPKNT
ncbi:MAG TPA: coenzyme F420-0:L-glutamate ligase [Candidatus Bathyarchaeia archaeon]|nr:coenzyme F420-0:L-glutamate ligase [Candidatus Bathyarchaeia archaeon]